MKSEPVCSIQLYFKPVIITVVKKLKLPPTRLLFCLILLLGVFVRIWEWGTLPPAINADEASSAVDAYSLIHYGIAHNGESFPAHFISYGSGQNALYAYLTIPFIALGGLTPDNYRLPMLLSGLLTLPLVFYVGRQIAGNTFGLLAMFFIAISPWHIILSRWGLDSNILPFLFLAGLACLYKSTANNRWFILACLIYAFSLYAYGTAYVGVPIMVTCAAVILWVSKRLSLSTLILGLLVLIIVGAPMVLYVVINSFNFQTIELGVFTIPHLPTEARFHTMAAVYKSQFLHNLKSNTFNTLNMLWFQTDRQPWNDVDPFGYFYRYTLPFAFIGALGLLPLRKTGQKVEKLLLAAWLLAAVPAGMLQVVNINRINILFIPLIICMAFPLLWLKGKFQVIRWLLIGVLLVALAAFTRDYHSDRARTDLNGVFSAGLLDAMQSVHQMNNAPVCVTSKATQAYIYALFAEQANPADYLASIRYDDPQSPDRIVRSFGRYTFSMQECAERSDTIYVLLNNTELPPSSGPPLQAEHFANFTVYKPY